MPVDLTIVESTTELGQTVVEVVLESASTPGPAGPGVPPGGTQDQVLTKQSSTDYDADWQDVAAAVDAAPVDATYLVTAAHADLDAEVVVGATPGGELGGTWAAPTVDATHSGSSHASVQAAAEATAAAALSAHLTDTADAHDASAISFTPAGTIAATDVQAAIEEVATEAGGGGAPTDVDYLVGTASGGLSAEIVVGTTPGGELGGTWASPTVDTTHSGSSHASVQAAAEATAAAALSAHLTDTTDAHDASAVSVDSTTLSGTGTDVQAVFEEIDNLLDDHSARHENGGADEISIAGLDGTPTELTNHLNDASAAHAASAISADSTTLVGTGTDVQAVLEELDNGIADHLADTTDAHDASAISFSPTGTIAATDVQAAIAEVASEAGAGGGIGTDGWVSAGETWTYASADDPTFTFTVAGIDLTGKYSPGMRVKLTQTSVKYFIITKVAFSTDTTITIYGGTDYDLANASISSPYYSPVKAPFGFPLDPLKWTVSLTDTSNRSQASATQGTWYNLGSLSLDIPIGVWDVHYDLYGDISAHNKLFAATLSTANNSESDTEFTTRFYDGNDTAEGAQTLSKRKALTLTAKTTYFLNASNVTGGGGATITFLGTNVPTRVRAICTYL